MQKWLILASSSPRRQELIRTFRLPYEVIVSDVDETTAKELTPAQVVEELSLRKAGAVADKIAGRDEPCIVVGSDTIVVLEGEILGKPKDEEDAIRMLQALQGREHLVYSGVACISGGKDARAGRAGTNDAANAYAGCEYRVVAASPEGQPLSMVGHSVSKVTFAPMSEQEIRSYVRTGEPLDKAGAYGVQGGGSLFIERIEGDFYSVMGLPVQLLYRMLGSLGAVPLTSS